MYGMAEARPFSDISGPNAKINMVGSAYEYLWTDNADREV